MKSCVIPGLYFKSYSRYTESRIPFEALALCGVMEAVEGCHCQIVDFNIKGEDVSFGESGVRFPSLVLDRDFYRNAAAELKAVEADLYVFSISIHTNGNMFHSVKVSQALRELAPDALILFAGLGPSSRHSDIIRQYPHIDVIIRGEAEATLTDIMGRLSAHAAPAGRVTRGDLPGLLPQVDGITFAGPDGEIISTPLRPLIGDLDSLPMPSLHLYGGIIRRVCEETKDTKYLSVEEHIHIEAGRGCPFRCTFCSNEHLWRRRYRLKSPERLIEEIRTCAQQYGGRKFLLHQQLFTANKKKTHAFCQALIESGLDIEWSCFTRNDCVDAELLDAMRASGCSTVLYGIESGSQRIQDAVRKKTQLDDVTSQIRLTIDHGIKPQLSYIIGFPEETREDLQKTIDMYFRYKFEDDVESQIGLLVPAGGTEVLDANITELDFDGVSTTTWYTRFFDDSSFDEMSRNPLIYPQNHYVKTPFLERGELKFIKAFDIAASYLTRSFKLVVLKGLSSFPFETYAIYRRWRAAHPREHFRARLWDGDLHWDTHIASIVVEFAQFIEEELAPLAGDCAQLLRDLVSYELHTALVNMRMCEHNYDGLCTATPPGGDDNPIADTRVGARFESDYAAEDILAYADQCSATAVAPPAPHPTTYTIAAHDATHVVMTATSATGTSSVVRPLFRQVEF